MYCITGTAVRNAQEADAHKLAPGRQLCAGSGHVVRADPLPQRPTAPALTSPPRDVLDAAEQPVEPDIAHLCGIFKMQTAAARTRLLRGRGLEFGPHLEISKKTSLSASPPF